MTLELVWVSMILPLLEVNLSLRVQRTQQLGTAVEDSSYVGYYFGEYVTIRYLDPYRVSWATEPFCRHPDHPSYYDSIAKSTGR